MTDTQPACLVQGNHASPRGVPAPPLGPDWTIARLPGTYRAVARLPVCQPAASAPLRSDIEGNPSFFVELSLELPPMGDHPRRCLGSAWLPCRERGCLACGGEVEGRKAAVLQDGEGEELSVWLVSVGVGWRWV